MCHFKCICLQFNALSLAFFKLHFWLLTRKVFFIVLKFFFMIKLSFFGPIYVKGNLLSALLLYKDFNSL